jgi:hypothetical protein
LNINLTGCHFDKTELIEAESQAVLNTTPRVDLKNGRKAGNGIYASKGTTSRVMVASRSKVTYSF